MLPRRLEPGVHVLHDYNSRRSPSVVKCPTLVGAGSIADPPRNRASGMGTRLGFAVLSIFLKHASRFETLCAIQLRRSLWVGCAALRWLQPSLLCSSGRQSAYQRRNRLSDRSLWRPCAKRSASHREMGVCRRLLSSRLGRTRAGWSDIPYGSVSLSAQGSELPGAPLHAAMAASRSVPAAQRLSDRGTEPARVR